MFFVQSLDEVPRESDHPNWPSLLPWPFGEHQRLAGEGVGRGPMSTNLTALPKKATHQETRPHREGVGER
jgi:hypothetical protein